MAAQLYAAIAQENAAVLAQVPEVGKRTAARVVLELKGKVQPSTVVLAQAAPARSVAVDRELQEVLESLGYSVAEAQAAIAALPTDAPTDLEERLRLALQSFGGA